MSQGYESTDGRPGAIFVAGLALLALMAVGLFVSSRLDESLNEKAVREQPEPHPMAVFRSGPSGPLLQAHPTGEWEQHAAWERETLASYGWVDLEAEIVHVPIERAMQRVLDEGLPARGSVPGDDR